MATLLIGYDTEAAAVGEGLARFIGPTVPQYRAALDPDVTRRGVALLSRLHRELDAPCTFFVCGRTLLHAMDAIEPLAGVDLFDIQQHTYSHVVFRDVRYRAEGAEAEAVLPETPAVALREELRFTSDLIRRYLGRECVGLRTPFGHYRGLRGRPDLLEIVRDTGHRFVSSWGRNEEIGEQDLVFATAFHEWCAVEADEEGTGWIRTLIEHARRRGVELLSFAEYWARTAGRIASTTTSPSTMTGRSSR